jgi:hypothetical protein
MMRLSMLIAAVCAATLAELAPIAARAAERSADVVVYGGTSAGVAAAVQTARMGKSVILISPLERLGGMTTGGLGATDSGNKAVIGGVAREFYQRIKKHYDDPASWKFGQRDQFAGYRPEEDAMWYFEPHVAQAIIEAMIREAGVETIRGQRLVRTEGGVVMKDGRIASIRIEPSGDVVEGRMFIDATYEGDLLAAAGVSFTVGRESNATYGEQSNGVQKAKNLKNHRFLQPVDPYVAPGDPESGLVAGVHDGDPGEDGAADDRVQAYCYRMCMSNVPENSVPFPQPAGYDDEQYELLFRNFEAGDLRVPMHPLAMPNGKTDTNNNGAFSTDFIGANYDYPEASYAEREEILRHHIRYQQGLMWTLANHPRVPRKVRDELAKWGLAKDEFTDSDNWPGEIYAREARRMVGDYVMSEHDCRRQRVAEDSVGMGSYNMDSHNCQRYVTDEGHVQDEGDVQLATGGPYAIGYRSIVPKRGEAANLLVPVCLSASHIAYGSIRMEPVFMILGQSAATAACQAIDSDSSVQEVDYPKLKKRLLADGQVLQVSK